MYIYIHTYIHTYIHIIFIDLSHKLSVFNSLQISVSIEETDKYPDDKITILEDSGFRLGYLSHTEYLCIEEF